MVAALAVLAGCASMGSDGWSTLLDGEKGNGELERYRRRQLARRGRLDPGGQNFHQGRERARLQALVQDFELYVEFWAADDTNSGVYLRAMNPDDVRTATGAYEAQIWDRNPDPKYASGSLVNVAPCRCRRSTTWGGRWNVYEIRAKAPRSRSS